MLEDTATSPLSAGSPSNIKRGKGRVMKVCDIKEVIERVKDEFN